MIPQGAPCAPKGSTVRMAHPTAKRSITDKAGQINKSLLHPNKNPRHAGFLIASAKRAHKKAAHMGGLVR
jgi:hypothetical protein